MQQGVHEYKSSAKARPVRRGSNHDYVLAEEMRWLITSLFVVPSSKSAAAKGKCQLVEVRGGHRVLYPGGCLQHVRPYSRGYLTSACAVAAGRSSVRTENLLLRKKERSASVRFRRPSATGEDKPAFFLTRCVHR
jgi:hypothetical protein